MSDVEPMYDTPDFGQLAARVEETGERVVLTADGEPWIVLLPAAELAELEHFAQRHLRAPLPPPDAAEERPPGPEEHGPYTRYLHADGQHATFTRGRAVVVEARTAWWLRLLDEQAMYGRQAYMPPKQLAAFEEFLARRPPLGEQ
ncbi:type II toxin-antitoxin system prevent-host-death family antitoxin [Streptomyces sp. NPDC087440]|uniref:type II toxin-antitoxin system prevent-host-death family antitoxin n=1 Tax=Streptomyces sp. NPDC087440 TaxID=3365790 RepID=UPI003800C8F6